MEEWNPPTLAELAKRDDGLQNQIELLRSCLGQLLGLMTDVMQATGIAQQGRLLECRKLLAQVNQLESGDHSDQA